MAQLSKLPSVLGLNSPVLIQENPDRENIFLEIRKKMPASNLFEAYECIYESESEALLKELSPVYRAVWPYLRPQSPCDRVDPGPQREALRARIHAITG